MRKKTKSTFLGFVVMLAIVLVAFAILVKVVPVVFHAFLWALSLVPLLLAIAGLYSCLTSNKQTNIKILWVIIILLAPLLGPILWFVWGKKNT
ncbi:MAG: PLD nuclease N-terminal domain-containing protein [Verrucomicrobiales bacterium]